MKKRSINIAGEEFILFYALVKWFVLAVISGVVVGAMTAFFILSLESSISWVAARPLYLKIMFLPLGLIVSTYMIKYLAPDARGHGTEKVIEAVHERSGWIDIKVIPVKLITTIITLAAGGSAGKEGPAAQIGAGLTSSLASFLHFNDIDRKKLVVCGISAGFAAVFGTPIAGAIFGLEALYIGQMFYDVMFPSFVSGLVSYQVAIALGMKYFQYPISGIPDFSGGILVWTVLAGVFFGLVALMHVEILTFFEHVFKKLKASLLVKALIGGAALLLLFALLGGRYLGLGTDTIDLALDGQDVPMMAFFWKSILTSITLSCGGSGGIVTPVFFIGATAGITFANIFGLNAALFGPIGFVAVLAGCANTPIAASVMAIELFGSRISAIAALACITAFVVSGHRSVYPSQVLARPKSPLIHIQGRQKSVINTRGVARVDKIRLPRMLEDAWRFLSGRSSSKSKR